MNGSYAIPPRPKPGRKPATDEPQTKRKAQNREAQRNFRQRKAQKLNDLELEVTRKDQQHKDETEALKDQIEALEARSKFQQQQMNRLLEDSRHLQAKLKESIETSQRHQTERDYWKARAEAHQVAQLGKDGGPPSASSSVSRAEPVGLPALPDSALADSAGVNMRTKRPAPDGCGNCEVNGDCACVQSMINVPAPKQNVPHSSHGRQLASPMSDVRMTDAPTARVPVASSGGYEDREIDFTTRSKAVEKSASDKRASVAFMTHPEIVVDKCGFCTDTTNCICAVQETALGAKDLQSLPTMAAVPLNRRPASTRTPAVMTGPGSCEDCQNNPLQREWCLSVAKLGKLDRSTDADRLKPDLRKLTPIGSEVVSKAPATMTNEHSSARYSVGCSDAFHVFDGRVSMAHDKMDWTKELVPLPLGTAESVELPPIRRDTLMAEERKWSAYEIDSASILGALSQHDRRHVNDKRSDVQLTEVKKILQAPKRFVREGSSSMKREGSRSSSGTLGRILN
jgi:hypothetical protein